MKRIALLLSIPLCLWAQPRSEDRATKEAIANAQHRRIMEAAVNSPPLPLSPPAGTANPNIYYLPTWFIPSLGNWTITSYTIAWGTNPGLAQWFTNTTEITNVLGPLSRTNHYWMWVRGNTAFTNSDYSLPLAWEPPITNWYALTGRTTTNLISPVWEPFAGSLPRVFTNAENMSDWQRWFAADFLFLSNNVTWFRSKERPTP
jgi:hypothetical protein